MAACWFSDGVELRFASGGGLVDALSVAADALEDAGVTQLDLPVRARVLAKQEHELVADVQLHVGAIVGREQDGGTDECRLPGRRRHKRWLPG